jgi:hypothetical protein
MSLAAALVVGIAAGWILNTQTPAFAGTNDRYQDFILATGPVNQAFSNNAAFLNAELDGVWLLDYKAGKLLASTINRQNGKMIAWGELDLVKEFEIAPRSDVHFMMTTGTVVKGQSVLYLVETNSGKMGVYSMMPNETVGAGNGSVTIRRHDMTGFRSAPPMPAQNQQQPLMPPGMLPQNPPPAGVVPQNPVQPAGFNGNNR